ncbi:MAG: hypothetical protein LBQ38_07590 [Spirochaetaceae bacterium]|jgi:hypothetical protein|nr:hypothetical protein [Spirochaetaceae bacterium]
MAHTPTGSAQYLAKFSGQSIACNQYALAKLGVDRAHCFLKLDEYVILCVPFQFGFKRSLFLASLSKQELTFFQRYINGIVGLSITFTPPRQEPIKFFIRCNLTTVGQMKGRENVGLFVVDYKATPDDLINMLGSYLENQERVRGLYEDYGNSLIRMTPQTAKILGYNMFATIMEPNTQPKRIQVFNLSTKVIEHLEASGTTERLPGTMAAYQLFFKKYRVSAAGTIVSATTLPQGIVRTVANMAFSPELVEIIDDYWFTVRATPSLRVAQ